MKPIIIQSFIFLFLNISVFGQVDYKKSSIISLINFGYGFYSPSDKIRTAYATNFTEEDAKYGGAYVNIKYLHKIKKLGSRLKLGGEVLIQGYRNEKASTALVGTTVNVYKGATSTSGLNAIFLSDLLLYTGEKINLHWENGLGVLFMIQSIREIPFQPTKEMMYTSQIVMSYTVSKITIDPQVGIVKGFSDNKIFYLSAGLGFSFYWNK
jgi:hypothetical protein